MAGKPFVTAQENGTGEAATFEFTSLCGLRESNSSDLYKARVSYIR